MPGPSVIYRDPVTPGEPLGGRIRRLRTARGWTQRELAEPEYNRAFLAKIEAGERAPSEEVLGHLAGRLGLSVDDLRHGRPPGLAAHLWDELGQAYRTLERGGLDEAETRFAEAESRAAEFHLPDVECYARFCLAEARWQRYDIAGAIAGFERAMEISAVPDAAPPWLRAVIEHRWAICQYLSGHATTAVARVEGALGELRTGGNPDPDAELALLTALLHPLVEMGELGRARRIAEDGHRVAVKANRADFVARFYRQAARLWQAVGLANRADAELAEALRLFTALGFDRDAARCRWARGFLLREVGRLPEARAELTRARDLLAEAGSQEGVIGATIELAEVCRLQGEPDEAEDLVHRIRPLLDASTDVEARAEANRVLGLAARTRGDLRGAAALLGLAADEQERAALRGALGRTALHLGDVLREQGKLAEAVAAYRRGLAVDRLSS
jgi:transcriptional regulator with XRE-family HTH domain